MRGAVMAPVLDAVGTIAAATGAGPVVGVRPTGMATGQMEVALVAAREATADIVCATAGWTQVGAEAFNVGDGGIRLAWFEHPYTAGDAAPQFSVTDGGDPDPNGVYVVMGRVSGHNPTTRLDVTATVATGNSETMTAPSITTATAGSLVLAGFFSSNDVTHATPGNGGVLVTNQLSSTGSQGAMSIVSKTIAVAGATGTFSLEQSTSARYGWVAATIAIRTATAGATVTPTPVASPATVASPTVDTTPRITPTPVATPRAVSSPTAIPGTVAVTPTPVASGRSVGSPMITITVTPAAVTSPRSVPAPTVSQQARPPLRVDFWALDDDGTILCPLPQPVAWDLSLIPGEVGAVRIEYPVDGINFDALDQRINRERDLYIQVRTDGTVLNALGAILQSRDGDQVEETGTVTFTGSFLTVRLEEAPLPYNPANDKGETLFAAAKAGLVLDHVLDIAQAGGYLHDCYWNFTSTVDSRGVPWPSSGSLTATFSPGTSVLEIAQQLRDWGLCEFEVTTDLEIRAYVPETVGVDHTIADPPTVLRRGRDLLASPRRTDTRSAVTDLLVAGKEGVYVTRSDASALARRGRRIGQYVSEGNLSDTGSAIAYGNVELARRVLGLDEVTHTLTFDQNHPTPLRELYPADWVYSDVGGGFTASDRERIVQLTVSQRSGDDHYSGGVVLRDLIAERDVSLQRQIDRFRRGTGIVGTSEPSPAGTDVIPPSAPTGVVVDSIAYQDDEHSQTLAAVTVGWAAVTTNAAGPATERAQAAVVILERFESGLAVSEEWTWPGAPALVNTHNDPLLGEYAASGSTDPETWLASYIAANSAGSTATDDVAGYKVQYAYLGLSQVGGIPSSNPVDEVIAYHEVTPSNGIRETSFTFGGVEAGANIAVRVAAFDNAGNQSAWSVPVGHDTAVDNVPPEAPSAPVQRIWFRTLDTHWDGLDFAGAPMPRDFDHVAVLMSQAASFIAPTLGQPVVFDPAVTGVQHVANLYGAGTWNQPDLPVGVGWYSALVAVDRAGNASGMSAIVGPATAEQLVSQDLIDDIIDATKLGPNSVESQHVVNAAITTAKILDAAIVNAKIANLAVNNAKIETLDVGKLTAGTMTATVTNSGLFRTATTGNRVEFDGAGIRLYQGTTVVGRWQTSDASMLMTGTYQSALSGERINIFTDGTMRFYPSSGTNYSQLANFGNDLVMRGVMDGNSRSGRVNVNAQGAGMNFSAESEIPSNLRAEFAVFDRRARTTAPLISIVLDGKLTPPDGTGRRVQFSQTNSSGTEIAASRTFYTSRSIDGKGAFSGNGSGILFDSTALVVTTASTDDFGRIVATSYDPPSSRTVKDTIADARAALDPLAVIRAARSKRWHYTWERWRTPVPTEDNPNPRPVKVDPPTRFGPIAEDLPEVLQVEVPNPVGEGTTLGVSLGDQIGVLWAAVGQIEDQQIISTSGRLTVTTLGSVATLLGAGQTIERPVTWDSTPPAAPTGGFAMVQVGSSLVGRVTAWIKTGSVTASGATVVIKNISIAPILPTIALPITVEVVGLGLYSPPYVPGAA